MRWEKIRWDCCSRWSLKTILTIRIWILQNSLKTKESHSRSLCPNLSSETAGSVEEEADLDPLGTWEVIDLITNQIKPRYEQIKLLEIAPKREAVFDYSNNRNRVLDNTLEPREEQLFEVTVLLESKKERFRALGLENVIDRLDEMIDDEDILSDEESDNIRFELRYGNARNISIRGDFFIKTGESIRNSVFSIKNRCGQFVHTGENKNRQSIQRLFLNTKMHRM